jgi:thiamine biosynthesis lipoprotein
MTAQNISRRRFMGVTAAAAGLHLVPFGRAEAAAELVVWRGMALGAAAQLQIHHTNRAAAERLIDRSVAELRRLEGLFSLYRDDSTLVALNRRGAIAAPPTDFVRLLEDCRRYAQLSKGRFDPTVQPLWTLHAEHFAKPGADPSGPSPAALAAARELVGWERVAVSADRVTFARRGMALTLNGIAQGYVTDRVADLLRAEGVSNSMIDLGEIRALGGRPDGLPWRVGLADPDRPGVLVEEIALADRALATSAPSGFRFDDAGRFNHLFDPGSGASARLYRSVSVISSTATGADALSTAFSFMAPEEVGAVLRTLGEGRAHLTTSRGERLVLGPEPMADPPVE